MSQITFMPAVASDAQSRPRTRISGMRRVNCATTQMPGSEPASKATSSVQSTL